MRLGKENGHYSYMKEMEEFQLDLKVCVKIIKSLRLASTMSMYRLDQDGRMS